MRRRSLKILAKIGVGVGILGGLAIPAAPLVDRLLAPYRTSAALRDEDLSERVSTLRALQASYPRENQQALLQAVNDADPLVRTRAASYLANSEDSPIVTGVLLRHMQQDPAGEVRLCCAVALSSDSVPEIKQAFIQSLQDPYEPLVLVACAALRRRGGSAVVKPIFKLLHHDSWRVRLEACKALIALNVADRRVLTALQALATAPEARTYDEQMEASTQHAHEHGRVPDLDWGWGTIADITKQARLVILTTHGSTSAKPGHHPKREAADQPNSTSADGTAPAVSAANGQTVSTPGVRTGTPETTPATAAQAGGEARFQPEAGRGLTTPAPTSTAPEVDNSQFTRDLLGR